MEYFSDALLQKARQASSVEELLMFAKQNNQEISDKRATELFAHLQKQRACELSDEELSNVTGGVGLY